MRGLDERWNISIEPLQAWGAVDKTAGISPLLIGTYQTYLSSSAYENFVDNDLLLKLGVWKYDNKWRNQYQYGDWNTKIMIECKSQMGLNNENPILLKVMPTNTHITWCHTQVDKTHWRITLLYVSRFDHVAQHKNQHLPVTCTNLWPLRIRTTEIHLDDLWAPLPGD